MRFRTITSIVAGAAALTLAVSGCSSSSTPSASSVASAAQSVASQAQSAASSVASKASSAVSSVQSAVSGAVADSQVLASAKDGKLVVGIKFTQPGLGVKNPDGTFSGFDVEVAKYVAKELGVDAANIQFVEANSAQREDLIAKGQVDYIVATYSITDARKEKVNFAGPYFIAHQDLLVKSDNTDITGPETMSGKILCSVTGSTSAQKIKDTYAADVALQEYPTYADCVDALLNGTIDAVTTDDVILAGFAAQHPGELKVVGKGFTDEKYGIGLKKDDDAGTNLINAAIAKMIADGTWKQALQDTVGPSGYTIPTAPTPGG
jgi:glutamate transport system substrate-binding protein